MKIEFTKMSGAGNDFIIVDNRQGILRDGAETARRMCDRHSGIGADGLLLLESSTEAAYRMKYYNSDGSYGGMCGNGGRCIAAYAIRQGIAPSHHQFEALDFMYTAELSGAEVVLTMKDPIDIKEEVVLPLGGKRIKGFFVNTGSPHVVLAARQFTRKGLSSIAVQSIGRAIRGHRRFSPKGANVNFVERGEGNSLKIRTYERGVEDETLACGTGSIAAAVYGHIIVGLEPPIVVIPKSGERLVVDYVVESERKITNVRLKGPARLTFTGLFEM